MVSAIQGFSPLQGLAQGVAQGARLGLMSRQIKAQERRLDISEERTRQAAKMGNLNAAFGMLSNKNVPASLKVRIWNSGVAPTYNELLGAFATGGADDPVLPLLDEWPTALSGHMKRAQKIVADSKMGIQDKLGALRALQVEAGSDIALAPMIEQFKDLRGNQLRQDTNRMVEILTMEAEPGDAAVAEAAQIRARSPRAVVEAAKILDERRKNRPKTDAERESAAAAVARGTAKGTPEKRPAIVKVIEGDEIVTYEQDAEGNLSEIGRGQRQGDPILRQLLSGGIVGAGVQAPPEPAAKEGATAVNPQTGERVILRNGKWEPMK